MSGHYFRHHITESITINKERKAYYSKLSEGRSDRIMNFLIASEYASLAPAAWYDLRAARFQKKGMDLLAREFMSMNQVGEFSSDQTMMVNPPSGRFDWKVFRDKIQFGLSKEDPALIRRGALAGLMELHEERAYFQFIRHMLESIYRFAYFIPVREEEARKLKCDSPKPLMMDIMKLHLLGFVGSYQLDEWCIPLQQEGIPIFRYELPDLLVDLTHDELKPLKHV